MSHISDFDRTDSIPLDMWQVDQISAQLSANVAWTVEVMDQYGNWVPETKGWLRSASRYSNYLEAVEGAVNAWRRSDRPARPVASLASYAR